MNDVSVKQIIWRRVPFSLFYYCRYYHYCYIKLATFTARPGTAI